MPVHELLTYIEAAATVVTLPLIAALIWLNRRDLRHVRNLYGVLLDILTAAAEDRPDVIARALREANPPDDSPSPATPGPAIPGEDESSVTATRRDAT